jgi:transcriptional regulator with PAS, ATPase and Fis domain
LNLHTPETETPEKSDQQSAFIAGESEKFREVISLVHRYAPYDITVLITGETGTGKEVIAKAIHYNSTRASGPLVAINCAAIPDNLLESELFGHERGAFTDAHARKLGHFESAHRGTIFLDEIGEMNPGTQAKLLRVLEQGTFTRVGGSQPITVDVRVVAATNRDLDKSMQDGTFRPDLYFRLNVVAIHLPPLRERREDLPLLIRHFLTLKSASIGSPEKQFDRDASDCLLRHRWPGNVRELENIVERALALSQQPTLGVADLPAQLADGHIALPLREIANGNGNGRSPSLSDAVDQLEHMLIIDALTQAEQNQTRAAELLGTTRRILKYKMDKLGIAGEDNQEIS